MDANVILHIEDNFHNRRLVRKILEFRDYPLVEAEDGISGLQMIQHLRPALVLLDIGLPGLDGVKVMHLVKGDPTLDYIPLVAITAAAMPEQRKHFLTLGFNEYIAKPLQPLALLVLVDALMGEGSACRA